MCGARCFLEDVGDWCDLLCGEMGRLCVGSG